MNAERLLEHFDRISDAPDAVPRLRRFVLDLAVRGRLVPQDASDEPVSALLATLDAEGEQRKRRSASSTRTDTTFQLEPRCVVPDSWAWVRLDRVTNVVMGSSPPGSTYNKAGDGVPLINGPLEFTAGPLGRTVINQYTTAPTTFCNEGDFLICVRGSTTGRTNVAAFRACIGRGVAAIQPMYEDAFVRLAIRIRQAEILSIGRGIAFPSISREQLAGLPVPMPPLAEQHRIVAKVDELMALCDRLEAAQAEREARRDRLVSASLARVTEPASQAPASARTSARFHVDHFARLTTRPEHVKQLRQTILNLAVRGRLVPQDSKDEAAAKLLNTLRASHGERDRRLATDDGSPHETPPSWVWAYLDDLVVFGPQNGISPKPTDSESAPKAITLTATTSGRFDNRYFKHVDVRVPDTSEYWLRDGDLLFQRGNTREYVGIAAVYTGPPQTFLYPDLMMKVRLSPMIDLRFAHLAVTAPPARAYFGANATGAQASMPKINQTILVSLPIPLPPLAEQRRIVEKVDELMALCDRLEASLASAATDRVRLLEAMLRDALVPAV